MLIIRKKDRRNKNFIYNADIVRLKINYKLNAIKKYVGICVYFSFGQKIKEEENWTREMN